MAKVTSLGYVLVDATDLEAWEEFASGLLGLHLSERSTEQLVFRMDEKSYRLIVEKSERDGVRTVGWEVGGPADLDELVSTLEADGYAVTRHTRDEARARRVTALASFTDPDDIVTMELYYGLRESDDRFVSPTGAVFETGLGGLGHVLFMVENLAAFHHLAVDLLGFTLSDHIETGAHKEIDLNFFHCNPRHHSLAFAQVPGVAPAVGHLMFEVNELDIVGRAWDKVTEEDAAPILTTLGKHTNDKMISFYVRSPSGFGVEYGTGGILIDAATWTPTRYGSAHYWGHHRVVPINPTDAADNA